MKTQQIKSAIASAVAYIHSKQCANGGFCAYKMEYLEEPNPSDTFFAVAALQTLGLEPPNRHQICDYLHSVLNQVQKNFDISPHGSISQAAFNYLYFPLYTLYRLGVTDSVNEWQQAIAQFKMTLPKATNPNTTDITQQWLLRKIRTKKICKDLPQKQPILEFVFRLQHDSGGFGIPPNLIETYWSLAVLRELDYDLAQLHETRNFIQQLQVQETGFSNTIDSLSTNMDVVYAGIFASMLLNLEIFYLESAMQFVLMCQMAKGGFARAPVALPDIETTYRALKILQLQELAKA
ncbi:prenyltransferase [Fischerella thermalis CCMEE 5282]|uniref:Geranylgeranyl transferase type II subunit beta n=1 Tax=Fischerella thermalis JSC-11 TaxID=741277 RepID=G6FMZ7_9CYAN|nr:prenyltransferase/squalene oxidase repeat-containing protein [Fischerella thermalis]EHC19427.1 Prenyltransferase/squalene oxidase [Fischerella thermalis JSC-11]PMB09740.1 prenyltransferase [Fischerella thermalis CCMEE 5328]PMB12662.1 prenyltransferase [Fischerella thermalis CCMEE 5282]